MRQTIGVWLALETKQNHGTVLSYYQSLNMISSCEILSGRGMAHVLTTAPFFFLVLKKITGPSDIRSE
jgi:hypothetical protein